MDTYHAIKDALEYADYALSAKDAYTLELTKEEIEQLYQLSIVITSKLQELSQLPPN